MKNLEKREDGMCVYVYEREKSNRKKRVMQSKRHTNRNTENLKWREGEKGRENR